jgi:hypothetical protein
MEPQERACEDCGGSYLAKRSNAKYCSICRLFRDLTWLRNRQYTCLDCEARFAPFKSNEQLCSKCDFIGSKNYVEGTCALCQHSSYPLLSADVAVCLGCARDPDKRAIFLKAIANKRRNRRDHYEQAAA